MGRQSRYYSKQSERLRLLLRQNDMTGTKLAELIHVPQQSISRFCRGERPLQQYIAEDIAEVFCINPAWLLGFDDRMKLTDDENTIEGFEEAYKAFLANQAAEELLKHLGYTFDNVENGSGMKLHYLSQEVCIINNEDLERLTNSICTDAMNRARQLIKKTTARSQHKCE